MTYSLKVCVETEELFLVLVKQQLHELLVDRLQLLVGVQRGEQILAILVDDLQDHQAVVGIVLVFPLGLGGHNTPLSSPLYHPLSTAKMSDSTGEKFPLP